MALRGLPSAIVTDSTDQELHPSAQRVVDWGRANGFEVTTSEHPDDGARTAEDAAAAVGCDVDQIVKSMIFAYQAEAPSGRESNGGVDDGVDDVIDDDVDDGNDEPELVLALTAGSNRVDGKALAKLAGGGRCRRADPEAVRAVTGYAIGGVPPFGHATRLRTWIDPHLLSFDRVWGAAGTPRHVFPIAPDRLAELTEAVEADFTS